MKEGRLEVYFLLQWIHKLQIVSSSTSWSIPLLLSQSSFLFKLQFSSSSSCCSFRLMLMAKTRQSSSAMANSNFFYMKTSLPRKMGKVAFCTTSCRFLLFIYTHLEYELLPRPFGPGSLNCR